ncbi:MAG: hypothetical protein JNK04_05520 [Myxococcales bacterium]|nr:hypothetical protein [Myxococcales bacterium]
MIACATIAPLTASCIEPEESESGDEVPPPLEETGTTAQEIDAEHPGLAVAVGDDTNCPAEWCGYRVNPDVTFTSFSAVNAVGATLAGSGAFIGPNTVITAAHLGGTVPPNNHGRVVAHLYRTGVQAPAQFQNYNCETMIQTLSTDTMVMYCPDIMVDGVLRPPGEVFGYVDMDPRYVTAETVVSKHWWNPIVTNNWFSHILYGYGKIKDTALSLPPSPYLWTRVDIPCNEGISGSLTFDANTHRAIIGPVATGSCGGVAAAPTNPGDTRALPLKTIFENMSIDTADPAQLYDSLLGLNGAGGTDQTHLGLITPTVPESTYHGLVDKNGDYVFDVQQALERLRGEYARPYYWFGFENHARNARWYVPAQSGAVTFNPLAAYVNIQHFTTAGQAAAMYLDKVALAPNTTYRVGLSTFTNSSTLPNGLTLQVRKQNGAVVGSIGIPTTAGPSWVSHALTFTTGADSSYRIYLLTNDVMNVSVSALSISKRDSIMTLDSHDERIAWRNESNGARAWWTGEGRPSTFFANGSYAARVAHSNPANSTDWTLRNKQLAFTPNVPQRVCFRRRSETTNAGLGDVRVGSGSGVIYMATNFTTPANQVNQTAAWSTAPFCTPYFTPTTGETLLQFGHRLNYPNYLVDEIQIQKQ